jgi:HSP20 family molecular chaperone IbpA
LNDFIQKGGVMKSELFRKNDERLIPENQSLFNDNILDTIDTGFHLEEAEDHYSAEIHAPGMSKEDFKIKVHDGVLYVSGEHQEKDITNDKDCYEESSYFRTFQQSFVLPPNADENGIHANMENGSLMIRIDKFKREKRVNPLHTENQNVAVNERSQDNFLNKIARFFKGIFK